MMNDCHNIDVREALPEFVHGALADPERMHVQEHLDGCADCASELVIIRAVYRSSAAAQMTQVHVQQIVAAIPPYRRKQSGMKRVYMELAAACLIGAIGISALVVHNSDSRASVQHTAMQTAAQSAITTGGLADAGLALVNTSELSDASLAALTHELDNLQAMPPADPESVTPIAFEDITAPMALGDSA